MLKLQTILIIIIVMSPVVWLFVKSQVTRFPAVSLHCNSSSVHQDPLNPLEKANKKLTPQKCLVNNVKNIILCINAGPIEPLALKMHTKVVESRSQYILRRVIEPLEMQHENARICQLQCILECIQKHDGKLRAKKEKRQKEYFALKSPCKNSSKVIASSGTLSG